MTRLSVSIVLAALALAPRPAAPADLLGRTAPDRFRATCEDLGTFCFADACGRDQIEAAQTCRALCRSAVILGVVPDACSIPDPAAATVLRRRG